MKKVQILYTGGTFGMDLQEEGTLAVPRLSASQLKTRLLKKVPELPEIAEISIEVLFNIDSCQMGPDHWTKLAEAVRRTEAWVDGVVILHGTDTLVYSAAALHYLLRPCRIPVILTGAQRPLSMIRNDARSNLITSVEVAAHGPRDVMAGVSVCFDDLVLPGNSVRKGSSADFQAFSSPRGEWLARVGAEVVYREMGNRNRKGARPLLSTKWRPKFSRRILTLHVTPGFPGELLQTYLESNAGLDAIVLVLYPSWTAPTHSWEWLKFIEAAKRKCVPVIGVTGATSASQPKYESGREMLETGVVFAPEMTPEAAYVKAAWILGQDQGRRNFKKWWDALTD